MASEEGEKEGQGGGCGGSLGGGKAKDFFERETISEEGSGAELPLLLFCQMGIRSHLGRGKEGEIDGALHYSAGSDIGEVYQTKPPLPTLWESTSEESINDTAQVINFFTEAATVMPPCAAVLCVRPRDNSH